MAYHIDFARIPIDTYKSKLEKAYLPPSRKILRERLEERFDHFKSMGITNVNELLHLLKKKDKVAVLAKMDCFKGDYLTLLLREINSSLPKPNKISDFKGIPIEVVKKLEVIGIFNTLKLYPRIITQKARIDLTEATSIPYEQVLELAKLTDLSRIKWVGATFARMLLDVGVDSVEQAAKGKPEVLHRQLNEINANNKYFKGHIGLNDIRIFVQAAGEVPIEVDF
jgi:hypothetical protein